MKPNRNPSCREVRSLLQNSAGGKPLPDRFAEHLERCPRCRSLHRFLRTYPGALAAALDRRAQSLRDPKLRELLDRSRFPVEAAAARRRGAARWAIPAAAAAMLLAAWGSARLYQEFRAERLVRVELSAEVERMYAGELLAGVESALARPASDAASILEGLAADEGLEPLGFDELLD